MLASFLGQRDAIAPLLVAIAASERTGRPLPHALFLGTSGRGKTTLAKAVAEDLDLPFVTLHGSSVIERGSITDKIMEARGGILFIDEIHRLPVQIAEDLYRVMDEGKLAVTKPVMEVTYRNQAVWLDKRQPDNPYLQWLWGGPGYYTVPVAYEKPTKDTVTELVDIGHVTILGATTDEALLPEPFYSRLSGLIVRLRPYTVEELAHIAHDHAISFGLHMTMGAALDIAERSRNTPRMVKQYTERVVDWVATKDESEARKEDVGEVMDMLGIDVHGLAKPHRDILAILSKQENGLSRTSLAQMLQIPPRNVEHYWADLAGAGMVEITTRHFITKLGIDAISG